MYMSCICENVIKEVTSLWGPWSINVHNRMYMDGQAAGRKLLDCL